MPKTLESPKILTADEVAELADKGENISRFFTNAGKMMPPIQRVNVDFALPMLEELDAHDAQRAVAGGAQWTTYPFGR
jgi:hypothetical protein